MKLRQDFVADPSSIRPWSEDLFVDLEQSAIDRDGERLDVSELFNHEGDPVCAEDVQVTSTTNGWARLIFPEGEQVVLPGFVASELQQVDQLVRLGIPGRQISGRVLTPDGPRARHELRVGDHVLTAKGGSMPIAWIGHARWQGEGHTPPQPPYIRIFRDALGIHPPMSTCPTQFVSLSPPAGFRQAAFAKGHDLVRLGLARYDWPAFRALSIYLGFETPVTFFQDGIAMSGFWPDPWALAQLDRDDRASWARGVAEGRFQAGRAGPVLSFDPLSGVRRHMRGRWNRAR